jgi:hypothetical protein
MMVSAALALACPVPASAQGLFDIIGHFLGIGRSSPPVERHDGPSASGASHSGPASEATSSAGGAPVAYCVRTCDGRYFPIAKNDNMTPAALCRSMCPAAHTEIYYGNTIENAYSQKGARYTTLANAFVYRDHLVDGCSCNTQNEVGMTSISYRNDPTLRPGDIVMTENGAVVFKGPVGPTHQASDFVPVQKSNRISRAIREKVIAMKAMPTRRSHAQAQAKKPKAQATAEAAKTEQAPGMKSRALGFSD